MDLIIFLIGGVIAVVSIVMLVIFKIMKKPTKKVAIGLLVGMTMVATGFIVRGPIDKEDDRPVAEAPRQKPSSEFTPKPKEEENSISWDNVKNKDNIVGKSNKDYLELTTDQPSKVRNDSTDKWRLTKIAKNIDITEYLLSYKDLYMTDGDTHWIINFNYDTTTSINLLGELLYIDIKEYQSKEEHDANLLGGGMFLKSYVIYPDGDIEKIGD